MCIAGTRTRSADDFLPTTQNVLCSFMERQAGWPIKRFSGRIEVARDRHGFILCFTVEHSPSEHRAN